MIGILAMLAMVLMLPAEAVAGSASKTLYKFKGGNDGGHPAAGLVFDASGGLYGTTGFGGGTCNGIPCGTVFKLTSNWRESVLYRFKGGSDGQNPAAGLIFDAAGHLYGTTAGGTVFTLKPNLDGTWNESVLYNFCQLTNCADGEEPVAGLIFDAAGSLYGTTFLGGAFGAGTVFKLKPNSDGTWTESVLHSFSGPDGGDLNAGLVFDAAGNLYGTTTQGGASGVGIIFKLTNSDGTWKEHVLHAFTGGKDGGRPYDTLILDPIGNLYGTTSAGGTAGLGTVFRLDKSHKLSVLHTFTKKSGSIPYAGLTFDPAGNFYGATSAGGDANGGVVFKLAPRQGGGWRYTVVFPVFQGTPGLNPEGTLVLDKAGHLYGTTFNCAIGEKCRGVVFEVTP
jgi:uncharacterized repeat protein (TIGR03803 family)